MPIRATLNVREKPNLGKTTKFAIHGELLQRDLPYNPDAEFRSLLVIKELRRQNHEARIADGEETAPAGDTSLVSIQKISTDIPALLTISLALRNGAENCISSPKGK